MPARTIAGVCRRYIWGNLKKKACESWGGYAQMHEYLQTFIQSQPGEVPGFFFFSIDQ